MTLLSSLDTARRALSAQQAAIQTTGNNISNASTPGYSRQRVDLQTSTPFPSVGMNQPAIAGQIGTGVEASTVSRVRDTFIDQQVRQQTTSNGYWSAKSDALSQMEGVMNEPSDSGLSKVLNDFWGAWQDLGDDPSNAGAQSVVVQDGQTVASTFQYMTNQLNQIKGNVGTNIGVTTDQINSLASQINDLNKQIASVEPSGMNANDLYDRRDQLVDQLSQLADVQVTTSPSGGNASPTAAGIYTIQMKTSDAPSGAKYATLVDGKTLHTNKLSVDLTTDPKNPTATVDGTTVAPDGKLKGLMDVYSQDFPNMVSQLDTMASTLADSVNGEIQNANTVNGTSIPAFFTVGTTGGAASTLAVSTELQNAPSEVAAGQLVSDSTGTQQIPVALSIANALSTKTYAFDSTSGQKATFQGYYQGVIGQMGVNAQAANRMSDNTSSLKDAATQRRDSVSGVSIDEEMTNLIQYQHAYSASARMVTTINQLLDTLVNLGK